MVTEPGPGAVPSRSRQGAAGRRVAELGTSQVSRPRPVTLSSPGPNPPASIGRGHGGRWGSLPPEPEAGRGRRWEEAPPGGSLSRAAGPRLPRIRPIDEQGHGGRWRRGAGGRCQVAALPAARPRDAGWPAAPRLSPSGRQVAASARGSELLRRPSRCGPRARPDPPASRVQPPVAQGALGGEAAAAISLFLCLSFPACDALQPPAPGTPRPPAQHSCRPPSGQGPGRPARVMAKVPGI